MWSVYGFGKGTHLSVGDRLHGPAEGQGFGLSTEFSPGFHPWLCREAIHYPKCKMQGAPHLQTELPSFASLDLAGMSPGKWRQFLGTWFHAAAPPAQGPWERWGRIREGPGVNLLCMALPLVTCHVAGSARCSWPPMAPSPVPALIPDLQTTHRGIEQLRPFVLGSRSDPGRGAGRTPLGPAALGER